MVREKLSSRLGFILISAGCAIGLGNIWRFPFITGKYGGAVFVLLYLLFLVLFGIPAMTLEFAVGRRGRSTLPGAMRNLRESKKFRWEIPGYALFAGNLILLMFYGTVTGWLLAYIKYFACGGFQNQEPGAGAHAFNSLLNSPGEQALYMTATLTLAAALCSGGAGKSIEKSIKVMMGMLFLLTAALTVQALRMPGAAKGLKFFLLPDWSIFSDWKTLTETVHAAMAQAFFTLSIGIGSMTVYGSYIGRDRSLLQESIWVAVLDTLTALAAGVIIFSCCATFDIAPNAGPPLIFITLPGIFAGIPGGEAWGTVFFCFLFIAALSTVVAVMENLIAFVMDESGLSRRAADIMILLLLIPLNLPCIFGFNLWKNKQPLGEGSTILDLEDFIISDNLLPLGALYITLFCCLKSGWGCKNTLNEVNTGEGLKMPAWFLESVKWILPVGLAIIWFAGIRARFA